jgi:FKBP-type peptidyl-prolyl cis-trans isomerase (trigger factor)
VLEAVADQLGLEVSDDELREFIREQEDDEEGADSLVERIWESGRHESLREDLRLRQALDRIVSEVKPIPVDLARAREKLWTPGQEKTPADTKIWTPGE